MRKGNPPSGSGGFGALGPGVHLQRGDREAPRQPLPQLPSTSSVLLHNLSSSAELGR